MRLFAIVFTVFVIAVHHLVSLQSTEAFGQGAHLDQGWSEYSNVRKNHERRCA